MPLKQEFRVLQIVNRMNLGGITYQICMTSKYLPENFKVKTIAGLIDETEASSDFIAENFGVSVESVNSMQKSLHPIHDFKAYKEIREVIKEFKPHIVHTHAAKAGAVGRLAAFSENVPIVLHTFHGHVFHSYFSPLKTKIFLTIEKYLAKKSTKTIAISNKQFEELCYDFKIDKKEKFEVIPLGFDLAKFQENKEVKRENFRKKYQIPDDLLAIGIVGRLVPIKNHKLFLDAFSKVKGLTDKKIVGVLIGDGELKDEILNQATELGLKVDDKYTEGVDIVFTSWIQDIEGVFPGLDIIALSSLNEGTPVSLIEAQAASVPVLSTKVGGIEDVVLEGETAVLVENNNLESFSQGLLKLVEDEALRESFSKNGYAFVQEKFGYKRLINDISTLYEKLLIEKQILNNNY